MKYELENDVINNILVFLDRVEIKGFNELKAMNKIVDALHSPIKENEENKAETATN